jgi:hypothetical protein
VSLSPDLDGDELAYLLGTSLPHAVVILALPSHQVVACNAKFMSLVGLDVAPVDPPAAVSLGMFLSAADLEELAAAGSRAVDGEEAIANLEWRRRDGQMVVTASSLTTLLRRGQRFLLLWLASPQRPGDLHCLDRRVEEQKSRALAAIKSSLRLYQLNEKIRRSTSLMQKLLSAASEDELFAEAARLLTGDEGLGYRDVTFVLQEETKEGGYRVVYSTREPKGKYYPLRGDSPFAQYGAGKAEPQDGVAGVIFPLANRKALVGLGRSSSMPGSICSSRSRVSRACSSARSSRTLAASSR